MARAITLAIYQQENPFKAALNSADNFLKLVADLMYGSQKRIEYTMAVATALFALSFALSFVSKTILQTCPV